MTLLQLLSCCDLHSNAPLSEVHTHAPLVYEGFGKFQWLMLLYTGLAWCADAMEMMLLSFLGPAVSVTEHSLLINIFDVHSLFWCHTWLQWGCLVHTHNHACPQSCMPGQQQCQHVLCNPSPSCCCTAQIHYDSH